MSAKTRKELTERAISRMTSENEDQIALAVIDFKKAKGANKDLYDPYDELLDIYSAMAEILIGIESGKESLLKSLVQDLKVNGFKKLEEFTNQDRLSTNWGARDFLEDKISTFWVKSLKYDAIIKALESQDSDEQKEKDTLAKVLAIIRKHDK